MPSKGLTCACCLCFMAIRPKVPPVMAACARFPGLQHGRVNIGAQRFFDMSGLKTRHRSRFAPLKCLGNPWKCCQMERGAFQGTWTAWKREFRADLLQKWPGSPHVERPGTWFCRKKGIQTRNCCKTRGFEHFESMEGLETLVLSRFAHKMAWKRRF